MTENNNTKKPYGDNPLLRHTFTVPMLCAVTFILLLLSRSVKLPASTQAEFYLALIAIELFVFMLPSVFYIRFRNIDTVGGMRLRLPSPDKIMFSVLCALILIFLSIIFSAISPADNTIYNYSYINSNLPDSIKESILYPTVAFALIPAVCEEFIFRGIVMCEYQRSSVTTAVILNSLYFSMLHFDIKNFLFYFISGLVLSLCTYATRSLFCAMAVHFTFNLFALFGGEITHTVMRALGDPTLIVILLIALLLIFLTLTFGECQRIYLSYAKKNRDSSYHIERKSPTEAIEFVTAALSPVSLVLIIIYIAVSLIL